MKHAEDEKCFDLNVKKQFKSPLEYFIKKDDSFNKTEEAGLNFILSKQFDNCLFQPASVENSESVTKNDKDDQEIKTYSVSTNVDNLASKWSFEYKNKLNNNIKTQGSLKNYTSFASLLIQILMGTFSLKGINFKELSSPCLFLCSN